MNRDEFLSHDQGDDRGDIKDELLLREKPFVDALIERDITKMLLDVALKSKGKAFPVLTTEFVGKTLKDYYNVPRLSPWQKETVSDCFELEEKVRDYLLGESFLGRVKSTKTTIGKDLLLNDLLLRLIKDKASENIVDFTKNHNAKGFKASLHEIEINDKKIIYISLSREEYSADDRYLAYQIESSLSMMPVASLVPYFEARSVDAYTGLAYNKDVALFQWDNRENTGKRWINRLKDNERRPDFTKAVEIFFDENKCDVGVELKDGDIRYKQAGLIDGKLSIIVWTQRAPDDKRLISVHRIDKKHIKERYYD
jgi:uncharacterized DUF497 family protein